MEIPIQQEIDIERLKAELQRNFPEYRIKSVPLNKKIIRLVNGMFQVVVGQTKTGKIICTGNINMLDLRIFIPFILLLGLFVIEGIVFVLIATRFKKQAYKKMEVKVGNILVTNILIDPIEASRKF